MRTKNKVYGSRQSLFVNKNIFAYKQYFLNKNIITIGSTISMYNNFIMRSHEFYKLISTFEKRRSLRFSTLRYKNIIKNLNFRRIKHKRKTKLIRRDRF